MTVADRYPLAMRLAHWARAILVLGLLLAGWAMTQPEDAPPGAFDWLYPHHKSFGLLALGLVLLQLAFRIAYRDRIPSMPAALPTMDRTLAKVTHRAMLVLLVAVPLMGYSMSSTFTQSDGVTFFGLHVPEILPKNDDWFRAFQLGHKVCAYALLALVVAHVAGTLKHRFFPDGPGEDVLGRMALRSPRVSG